MKEFPTLDTVPTVMVNRMEHAAIFLVYNLEDYMQTLLPAARCAVHGKLGQMWTDFEPKRGSGTL